MSKIIVTLPWDEFTEEHRVESHKNCTMRISTHGVLCIHNREGDAIQFYPDGTWDGARVVT